MMKEINNTYKLITEYKY